MEAPPGKRAYAGGAERSEEDCLEELLLVLNGAPKLRMSKATREWSSLSGFTLPPQDGEYPIIKGKPQPKAILEDVVDESYPQRLYYVRYVQQRQSSSELRPIAWFCVKNPAKGVKEDHRFPQHGEPEWRFRVWLWPDNTPRLLEGGLQYHLAALWYCGEKRAPPAPTIVAAASPVAPHNPSKQRHGKQQRHCRHFKEGNGVCLHGASCDFSHEVPDEYHCELQNTQMASKHFLDFHCAFCGRLIASAVDIYRINKGDAWARGLYNSNYLKRPEGHNIFKAMATRSFGCICRPPTTKIEHGYYAPEMKLFKLFLFSKKVNKYMFYWKRTPGAPADWHHEPLRAKAPYADAEKRFIELEVMQAGLADSVDEAAEQLNKLTLHPKITIEQKQGRMRPPPPGCPLCLQPDVERPVRLCDCRTHHMCSPCGDPLTVCPVCPGQPDRSQPHPLWPDSTPVVASPPVPEMVQTPCAFPPSAIESEDVAQGSKEWMLSD